MGLLSSIKSGIVKTATAAGKTIAKVLDTTSVSLAHPLKVAAAVVSPTKTVAQVQKEFDAQSLTKKVTQIVTGTAGIAATVGGVAATGALGAAAKAGKAATVVKSVGAALIPSTTKGKVIATAIAIPAVPALISSPKLVEKVVTAPSELAQFGTDVGKLAQDPSIAGLKQLVKESPIITTAAAVGTVAVVGLGTAGLISTISNTMATKEATKALKEASASPAPDRYLPTADEGIPPRAKEIPAVVSPPAPQSLAETQTIPLDTETSTRKRRRQKKKVVPNINQRVNVIVSNRASSVGIKQTKRYLNRIALAV